MTGLDDSSSTSRRRIPVDPGSTLSATTLDGGGQHSGRSRMARSLGRAAARARPAVRVPAVRVEDLMVGHWQPGPPPMLYAHLYCASATVRCLDLDGDRTTIVLAAVPQLSMGDGLLAVLQLHNGTFLQVRAEVLRQGTHRLQLVLLGLTAADRAQLRAAFG